MGKRETIIVLGAGASVPYGFPAGINFKTQIIKSLIRKNQFSITNLLGKNRSLWDAVGVPYEQRKEVGEAFNRSEQLSIDLFLMNRSKNDKDHERAQRFLRIGKLAIADVIMRAERAAKVHFDNRYFEADNAKIYEVVSRHWYPYLWRAMALDGLDAIKNTKIGVITFNYDRSFEYALYHYLMSSFAETDSKVREVFGGTLEFDIYHIHGLLAFPEFDARPENANNQVPYGSLPKEDTTLWERAANNIKLAGESIKAENPLADERTAEERLADDGVYEWIAKAKRIFFVGFSFAKENCETLRSATNIWDNKDGIHSNVYNMMIGEKALAQVYFGKNGLGTTSEALDAVGFVRTEGDKLA